MSKFKLESHSDGVIWCHVYSHLNQVEALQISEGIEKLIKNGKTHVVVAFAPDAGGGEYGQEFLEKALRHLKVLASKMGGNVEIRVESLEKGIEPPLDPEKEGQKKEIATLKAEVALLKAKLEEFSQYVTEPSTDLDLKKAVEFYRNLAMENSTEPLKKGS